MIALALAASLESTGAMPAPPLAARLHVAPCTMGKSKVPSICGTYRVYEDRAAASGRTIALHFIVLKAKHPSGRAIAWNPGGPGGSATDVAAAVADAEGLKELVALRDRYDILLVDNRGTGGSAPQQCDFSPPAHPELYFAQLWPDALVRSCRAKLSAYANLNLYSTEVVVDDLDDLRAALGYPKLMLDGGSYGTRFYLAFARQHPDRVESIVLVGVAPPHFLILPLEDAAGAQSAIDNLISECKADANCNKHFPDFGAHFSAVVRRFNAGPIDVPVRNAVTKRVQTVKLSKEVFADRLRQGMYDPDVAAYVPYIIERAYRRDYAPLATFVDVVTQGFASELASGLNLSVACAEDIPFITESDVVRTSVHSFEGDLRVRAEQRACAIWNVKAVDAGFVEPVRSDAQILMISGSADPATPASYAKAALAYLPNGRMVLVKGAGHGTETDCTDRLMIQFVRAGSAKGLNLNACSAAFEHPPFATSMKGFGE
jgi:pimeloyl-ACP methyl ester carboxylesterase